MGVGAGGGAGAGSDGGIPSEKPPSSPRCGEGREEIKIELDREAMRRRMEDLVNDPHAEGDRRARELRPRRRRQRSGRSRAA